MIWYDNEMINVTMTMISYHDFYIYLFVARCLVRLRKQYEALADPLVVDISKKWPQKSPETIMKTWRANVTRESFDILRATLNPFKPLARRSENRHIAVNCNFSIWIFGKIKTLLLIGLIQ